MIYNIFEIQYTKNHIIISSVILFASMIQFTVDKNSGQIDTDSKVLKIWLSHEFEKENKTYLSKELQLDFKSARNW